MLEVDPDDPDAHDATMWECAPYEGVGECGVAPPAAEAAGACAWALPPRALAPGAYDFNVLVSAACGDAQNASVTVNVTAGLLPVVSILLDAPKQSPDGKLVGGRRRRAPAADADGAAPIALEWAIDPWGGDGVAEERPEITRSTGVDGAGTSSWCRTRCPPEGRSPPTGRHDEGRVRVGVVDGGDQPAAVGRRV